MANTYFDTPAGRIVLIKDDAPETIKAYGHAVYGASLLADTARFVWGSTARTALRNVARRQAPVSAHLALHDWIDEQAL